MLQVPGRILWDFWTIEQDGWTWLYALSAPRDPNPDTRHDRARVEVARSRDLKQWEWLGVALKPGEAGSWDDLAIWTGSVAKHPDGGFAMLYTGRNRGEDGKIQRIGLAHSSDLIRWVKHPDPVLEADPKRYRINGKNGSTNWRDPWLEWCSKRNVWRAWITAQHPDGSVETSGCIALAESSNLIDWQHLGPRTNERLTEHMEVPQLLADGTAMLVNTYAHHVPTESVLPKACMSLLFRRSNDGSFRFTEIIEAWPSDERYVVKQVRKGLGLCWNGLTSEGKFIGKISEPFELVIESS